MEAAHDRAGKLVKAGHLFRFGLWLLPILFATLGLAGCDSESYSAAIRYLIRTDPLVLSDKLGPERYQPDTPGELPLMSPKDILEHPKLFENEDLFKAGKLLDPARLSPDDRQKLQDTLDELFGTPANPKVDGLDDEIIDTLQLKPEVLKKGSHYYRIHCLHCHGVTGNGRGPTSHWVNPHPRDYRQGLFKFQSSDQSDGRVRKPRRDDIVRTLRDGIEGTAMPSFFVLSTNDLNYLASYVIHLSIRGETEYETIRNVLEPNAEAGVAELARLLIKKVAKNWFDSNKKPIDVPPYPFLESNDKEMLTSVQKGQALFLADEGKLKQLFPKLASDPNKMNTLKGASCVSCHKDYGRQATFKFDVWGTFVRPADLTRGVYRGGRRPVDIYYRIHSGINGSGMANFGSVLEPDQIWDLVNFVRVLPYKGMRDKYSIPVN
jgi:mono/diheme cytochrome c family protein